MRNVSGLIIEKRYLTLIWQEVIFGKKLNKPIHPNLTFNNSQVSQTKSPKSFGLILDNKLKINEHLKGALDRISKTIGLIRKFQPILPRFSLLTIYKTFVRPHLYYEDIIYDQKEIYDFTENLNLFSIPLVKWSQAPS